MSHLLLVEDDDDMRQDLAALLELKGYEVRTAANGLEALTDLRRTAPPCAILLDLMMPVMDGWEFRATQLREPALAELPVVVISGVADGLGGLGAHRVLAKPVKLADLLAVIAPLCRPAPAP